MFKKILIANREEIACRVAETAKRLGVRTVAVYSDADANAQHVRACDEAVHIGGNSAKDSYLQWQRILAAAKATVVFDPERTSLDDFKGAVVSLGYSVPDDADKEAAEAAYERITRRRLIVAAALTSHGLLATWIDARRAVVTTGDHTAAAPLFPETTAALMAHVDPPLAAGRVPVVGGFVGATSDGVTTTLGRGGSDTTAVALAATIAGADDDEADADANPFLGGDEPAGEPEAEFNPFLSEDSEEG